MIKIITKILPIALLWGIFVYVVLQIPYPLSLTQSNILQLFSFFIPLFFALSLTINLFLKNIFSSASIALGLIFLLILKALDSINLVTTTLTVLAAALLISYFRKAKNQSLTNRSKIPKLTQLRKQQVSSRT